MVILRMDGVPAFVYHGIKTVFLVGGIFDSSDCTIGVVNGVRTFEDVAVAIFLLAFHVTGVWVFDSVVERVFWMCLCGGKFFKCFYTRLEISIGLSEVTYVIVYVFFLFWSSVPSAAECSVFVRVGDS